MKYKLMKTCMLMTVMSASLLLAQDPRPGDHGSGPNPGDFVQRRVNFLAAQLNLTDTQKADATTIFQAAYDATTALRPQITAAQKALNDATKTNPSDSQINTLAANLGALEGQAAAINAKAAAKFYAILTPDQRTKYDSLPGGGFGGLGGFGPRGRRPPPPGSND